LGLNNSVSASAEFETIVHLVVLVHDHVMIRTGPASDVGVNIETGTVVTHLGRLVVVQMVVLRHGFVLLLLELHVHLAHAKTEKGIIDGLGMMNGFVLS
jgi:hypothetical protein